MSYNAIFVEIGTMRIGTGRWGVIYTDDVQKLRTHRVSYLTRPQDEEHYGDKDVLHEQITVEDKFDPQDSPPDFHQIFDLTEEGWYNGSTGLYRWWSDGQLFVRAVETIEGKTVSYPDGSTFPAGLLRTTVEAYRVQKRGEDLFLDFLDYTAGSPDYIIDSGGHEHKTAFAARAYTIKSYAINHSVKLYDHISGWNMEPGWLHRGTILEPTIPYYWREWMWSMHPPIPVTDYEAYSECYRNAVANVTQSGMNNIANIIEVVDTIKDIKNGEIAELFSSFKKIADGDQFKVIKTTSKNLETGYKQTVRYVKWDSRAKRYVEAGQEAWLKYRYVYGTTKADADAAVDYFLDEKWKTLTDRQVVRGSIGLSDGQMRLKMRLREKADLAYMLRSDFKSVGLFPDLHTLWDLVPYSFVVDWIVPTFSTELEDLSQKYLGAAYDVQELLVTRKREWDVQYGGFTYHCKSYSRTFDSEPPQFEFYEESSNPKKKTVIKRIIDGFSLFIK